MLPIDTEIAGIKIGDPHPTRLMGIINLSEESFYKGSIVRAEHVAEAAIKMVEGGADMLDIGARSTAPGVNPISIEEEEKRLLPALKDVLGAVDVPVSVDTQYAGIAEKALRLGAHIINDISGLKTDSNMASIVSDFDVPVVLMASKKKPGDCLTFQDIKTALSESITLAEKSGIDKIIIDPGIGRWVPEKTYEFNLAIVSDFERFRALGKPVLVAISRKSFIGDVLGIENPADRLAGTLACTAIAVYKGAHIIRTHDVEETMGIIRMSESIKGKPITGEKENYRASVVDYVKKPKDSIELMKSLNVTGAGAEIMKDKAVSKLILLQNVAAPEALIIKQEMLARGGDAATSREAILGAKNPVDVLIIGTVAQIQSLIQKLRMQALNLPKISDLLEELLEKEDDVGYRYSRG
ncbi:MAG: dihydropteroate synthase [Methanosarcinales archaeon]|nr:MAG: dihydropteroate synthase [Methanosarcinales archaeon]